MIFRQCKFISSKEAGDVKSTLLLLLIFCILCSPDCDLLRICQPMGSPMFGADLCILADHFEITVVPTGQLLLIYSN